MEENPEWLDEEYLKLVLKSSVEECTNKEDLTIEDYKATRAVEKGKNYSSTIYRLQVLYKHNSDDVKKKTYIVKKIIPGIGSWIIDKETEIYKSFPRIEQNVNSIFAPRLYMCKDDSLVMEDLSEQGYQNVKIKLLDYPHCELALKALAKLHAGFVQQHQQNPKLVEEIFCKDIFINNTIMNVFHFYRKSIISIGEEISRWPESQQYAKYMPVIADKIEGYFENLSKRDGLRVLNHGDFHLHNMMFRYDSDKVCEVRLVDFQVCRFAPPTCDLQYFIATSADLDVRQNRQDDLFNVYLKTFNDTLAGLGIPLNITKQQFEDNLKKDYLMYFAGLTATCIFLADDDEEMFTLEDVGSQLGEELLNRLNNIRRGKRYRDFISALLDDLDKKGVFQSFRQ